jgi:regulator of sigma E protease
MDKFIYIPAFLFALGIIVFVHEWGHHIVARLCGVRVVTFSLGFGKRIWGFMHRGTDYRISIIPLGGYVRMGGEMPEEHTGDPTDFLSKPRWQRVLVYIAGPAMNVVLSLTLTTLVFMHGIDIQALQELSSEVGVVEAGSAAEKAGLLVGDHIVKMDGEPVDKWKDVGFIFATSPNRPVEVEYLRGEQIHKTTVTPAETERDNFGDAGIFAKGKFRLSDIMKGTPARRAGFKSGDEPRAIDGRPIVSR